MQPLDRKILHIALPAIASNITVPLLGIIDLAIVGHLGSAAYIGAIAVGSMVFNVMYWLFAFLRMGTSGMTSQSLGAHRLDESMRMLVRSLSIATAIALLLIALQVPLFSLAMKIMQPTPEVSELSHTYFNICIWGAPAVLCMYGINGWFIGMQNSRTPMTVAITQNLVNIAASLLFVYGLGMKVEGVALGTLVAQYAGLLISLVLWHRYYYRLRKWFSRKGLFQHQAMHRFFSVNRDIFLRTFFLIAVNFFITSAGAWQGDDILATNALLMQFFLIFSYFADGFAYAGEALCGKAYGGKNWQLLNKAKNRIFRMGIVISAAFVLLFITADTTLASLLTDDCHILELSHTYMPWLRLVPIAGIAAFIWDGIFIGCTATRQMLLTTFIGAVTFFGIYYSLPLFCSIPTNHILWLAFISYLFMRGVTQTIIYHRFAKRTIHALTYKG